MNTKQNFKVSVCMITYGHEDYIKEAIEGVLMQDCDFEIELLIADDCSPDATQTIVEGIKSTHKNGDWIKYIKHQTNKGMMPNFIWALNECKGKYVALCEGDDYWTDSLKLQKQIDFLEVNNEFSGCFHNTKFINELEPHSIPKLWREYDKNIFFLKDTLSNRALFHTASFVFKSSALVLPDWLVNIESGDMAVFTIVSSKGKLFRFDESWSVYRKNITGVTNNVKQLDYHRSRINLFQYFNNFLKGREKEQIIKTINFHKDCLKRIKTKKSVLYMFKMLLKKIKNNL
ncbi:glycosyltransferase [uncultured Formosa sp.]|uniref:glycosyltransferase n=1 Tax=uncultured Formosa sp. TaxID=255435 RepID=UPI00260E050F|nr:glycosyltransferase [uncultured Formosa sp.]